MNNKVIYTCVVGGYDVLVDPVTTNKGWDYICFSNELNQDDYNVWQIRPIPFVHNNLVVLSRFPKLRPDIVLKDYDISFYHDANIRINSEELYCHLDNLSDLEDNYLSVAIHPERNCLYDEAIACLKAGKASFVDVEKHLEFLKKEGFPKNYGLHENNLILRKHHHPIVKKIGEEWWNLFVGGGVKRDQLSLEYVLWKLNANCKPLFFKSGFNVRNDDWFDFKYHDLSLKEKVKKKRKKYLSEIRLFMSSSSSKIID